MKMMWLYQKIALEWARIRNVRTIESSQMKYNMFHKKRDLFMLFDLFLWFRNITTSLQATHSHVYKQIVFPLKCVLVCKLYAM